MGWSVRYWRARLARMRGSLICATLNRMKPDADREGLKTSPGARRTSSPRRAAAASAAADRPGRQFAPEIEAAARHQPRPDAQRREGGAHVAARPREAEPQSLDMFAIAAVAERSRHEVRRQRARATEGGRDGLQVDQRLDPLRPAPDIAAADGGRERLREASDADHAVEPVETASPGGRLGLEIGEDVRPRR